MNLKSLVGFILHPFGYKNVLYNKFTFYVNINKLYNRFTNTEFKCINDFTNSNSDRKWCSTVLQNSKCFRGLNNI